jgi:hypothetical protein
MTAILSHICSLEAYVERSGGRLVRAALPDAVHGGIFRNLITLHADLNPQQQLSALVHELAHWLAHRDGPPHAHGAQSTIFEYEAEAVEALVMARLGLPGPECSSGQLEASAPTDDLLSSSVKRVRWVTRRICQALGLEPQPPVHFETAPGKEVVLENKQHGAGNLFR